MIANAAFIATLIFLALGFWLMHELHFLVPWRNLTLRDLAILRECEPIYTTLEHQALCAAWQIGSTNAERIRQWFQQRGLVASCFVIPLTADGWFTPTTPVISYGAAG